MSFKMMPLFFEELGNTLTMTFVSSFLAYIIGIPLGILLVVWARDGIRPMPRAQEALGMIINLIRSLPFLILLIAIQSFTRTLVGTTVGTRAIIVPLTLASAPYIARIVESLRRPKRWGLLPGRLSGKCCFRRPDHHSLSMRRLPLRRFSDILRWQAL